MKGMTPAPLRDRLITVALGLVDEGGAGSVSVREAARRAGVSPGAPFRHFADRDALLEAVAELVAIDFFALQSEAAAQADCMAFEAVGVGVVRYALAHPHRFDLLRSALHRPGRSAALDEAQRVFDAFTTSLVAEGQAKGEIRDGDPEILRLAGHALAYGLAQMIIEGYLTGESAEERALSALKVLAEGIVRRPVRV